MNNENDPNSTPQPPVNPEEWLEREAGGDEVLLDFLRAKEELMEEIAAEGMGPNDPYNRKLIDGANELIARRRRELGMDQAAAAEIPNDKED